MLRSISAILSLSESSPAALHNAIQRWLPQVIVRRRLLPLVTSNQQRPLALHNGGLGPARGQPQCLPHLWRQLRG